MKELMIGVAAIFCVVCLVGGWRLGEYLADLATRQRKDR